MATTTRGKTLSDEEVDSQIGALDDSSHKKLARLTNVKVARDGFSGVRIGSERWLRARRDILRDILKNDVSFSEIEEVTIDE